MIKFLPNTSPFAIELKEEIAQYFSVNNISEKGNFTLHFKTFFWLSLFAILYAALVFFHLPYWLCIPLCIIFGCSLAGIGFNIMHDASHKSYSDNATTNTILAHSLDFVGASELMWVFKHHISHHTFVNTEEDDDINVSPLLRLRPDQKWHWWYKLQVGYMWVLYCLEYVGWVFIFDMIKYFKGKVSKTKIRMNFGQHIFFWASKIFYVCFFIVMPLHFVGILPFIVGYAIAASTCGLVLSIVFQMAHVQEKSTFPVARATEKYGVLRIDKESYQHQIETTANFATRNRTVSWLLGGLNFQIEHHLFPRISHVHYPAISRIVKSICDKHKIVYNEYPTMHSVISSHVRLLKTMSKPHPVYA